MAAMEDLVSNLKNAVLNIGQLIGIGTAMGTTAASINSNLVAINTAVLTTGFNDVVAINAVAAAILTVFPRVGGTFTLANATVTVVTEPATHANSIVLFTPTNATGALSLRTMGLYASAFTAGASFSLSTQSGSATGTETFQYVLVNLS